MKYGAVEGNTAQLPIGFAVLRLQLLFGSTHRAAPALPVAEHMDEGLCQALVSPALLSASCCDVFAADTAGADGAVCCTTWYVHSPIRTGPQEKCEFQTTSESLMQFPCLAWTSSYYFEYVTYFSLEEWLIFFLPKLGLPTWIFLPLKCSHEKSV